MSGVQALLASGLVLVYLFAGKLRLLGVIPRSGWLSMAGDVSVAYVFFHIFPELNKAQKKLGKSGGCFMDGEHACRMALCGLVDFTVWREGAVHHAGSRTPGRKVAGALPIVR